MGVSTYPEAIIPAGMLMPSARSDTPVGWLLCDGAAVSRTAYLDLFTAIGTTYGTGDGSTTFNLPNLKGRTIVMRDAAQPEFDVLGEVGGVKSVALGASEMPSHGHSVSVVDNNFSTGGHSVDHSHYVHGNNFNTGTVSSWHRHAINHWHLAWTSNMHWNATQAHGHHDRGGIASEAVWEGANWAGGTSVNVDGNAKAAPGGDNWSGDPNNNHSHNANHDHGSAGASANHSHTANHGHSASSGSAGSGGAHNNLQPYLAMNYLIKT